jgi:hypothetical protein
MDSKKRYGLSATATASRSRDIDEKEREMLRGEFEVMQRCDFAFIKEIGASNAEEYIMKITSLEFLQGIYREEK